ncbi:hypothetical protein OG599_35110 (plasmid) [Streptomyces sp. NBC_01335]|uniref:hypothetical protein n=1 Tax=Streptomyces sp. NBC_01335 TaxID=2903828 RepID=UPI002E143F02|nr:hypothetical protein OG599_35110 [Streptomyces sp. NBC_01335]
MATLVELPDPATLSDAQQRGAGCVWCAASLTPGDAHDLGPRPDPGFGGSVTWFPRCCITCWEGRTR